MSGLRKGCLYVGIRGHVLALDAGTGAELWRTKLKGADFVNVQTDDARVYAATKGEVFALEPYTGRVLWNNPLKGMGLGLATLAPADGDVAPLAEESRRRAAQAAAAG